MAICVLPPTAIALVVVTINTTSLSLSRGVEAWSSRLFELGVFDFHRQRASAHRSSCAFGPDTTELAQGRADRSKTAKVIFRPINMFEPPI
jgi:hypothetical protein